MKKFLTSITTLLISLLTAVTVLATPAPMPNFFVNDFANVLSEETRQYIISRGTDLEEISDAQLVIVTTNFTDGLGFNYATNIFDAWEIGSARANNGLLILLAIAEDNYFFVPGDGIRAYLTDGRIDDILFTYLEPHFDAGDFDTGTRAVFSELMNVMENHYRQNPVAPVAFTPISADTGITTTQQIVYTTQTPASNTFGDLLWLLVIIIVLFAVMSSMGARRRRMGTGMMMGGRRRRGGMGGFGAGMMMGSMMGRNNRRPTVNKTVINKTIINKPSSGGSRYTGNSSAFGGGGRSSSGGGSRGGITRSGGGGRSSGGGGRRR